MDKSWSRILEATRLGPNDRVSLSAAVQLLAERVAKPEDSERQTKDKILKRLKYDLGKGHISPIDTNSNLFQVGVIVAWAESKWPGQLSGLPKTARVIPEAGNVSVGGLNPSLRVIPPSFDCCVDELEKAQKRIEVLERELAAARVTISTLLPQARKHELRKERNRRSAQQTRKGK